LNNNNNNNNNRGTINNNDRIAATMYFLGTWFVWGICVDTLHKGENDNNNNNNKFKIASNKRDATVMGSFRLTFTQDVAAKPRAKL
jgi:hypothetical protein